jgi:hypothetical protein
MLPSKRSITALVEQFTEAFLCPHDADIRAEVVIPPPTGAVPVYARKDGTNFELE